jgi:hypothetical protein
MSMIFLLKKKKKKKKEKTDKKSIKILPVGKKGRNGATSNPQTAIHKFPIDQLTN